MTGVYLDPFRRITGFNLPRDGVDYISRYSGNTHYEFIYAYDLWGMPLNYLVGQNPEGLIGYSLYSLVRDVDEPIDPADEFPIPANTKLWINDGGSADVTMRFATPSSQRIETTHLAGNTLKLDIRVSNTSQSARHLVYGIVCWVWYSSIIPADLVNIYPLPHYPVLANMTDDSFVCDEWNGRRHVGGSISCPQGHARIIRLPNYPSKQTINDLVAGATIPTPESFDFVLGLADCGVIPAGESFQVAASFYCDATS